MEFPIRHRISTFASASRDKPLSSCCRGTRHMLLCNWRSNATNDFDISKPLHTKKAVLWQSQFVKALPRTLKDINTRVSISVSGRGGSKPPISRQNQTQSNIYQPQVPKSRNHPRHPSRTSEAASPSATVDDAV